MTQMEEVSRQQATLIPIWVAHWFYQLRQELAIRSVGGTTPQLPAVWWESHLQLSQSIVKELSTHTGLQKRTRLRTHPIGEVRRQQQIHLLLEARRELSHLLHVIIFNLMAGIPPRPAVHSLA
jgi:hypothetical protein